MKRLNNIISEVVSDSNLIESLNYVMRGTKRKNSISGRYIINNKSDVLSDIKRRILDGSFEISGYHEYIINERGKERVIQSVPLKDRIALNAIMNIAEGKLNKKFIHTTASSIKGRGGLYLLKKLLSDLSEFGSVDSVWVYKCDIYHFYQSIPQDKMIEVVKRYFKDKIFIDIISRCIKMLPHGISIGLRTSQSLGNLYLSHYIDHVLKDEMGIKYYYRYCDDMIVLASNPRSLTPVIQTIKSQADIAGLKLKPNDQVFCLKDRFIDFLGYKIYSPAHIELRNHIKKRFAKRYKRIKSENRRRVLVSSLYGMAKHSNSKNLFYNLTNFNMMDFKNLGFEYVSDDGKKHFECPMHKLQDLQNRTIIVQDFERGVKTKEGEDCYLIKFEEDELKEGKFVTNCDEIKKALDFAEVNNYLPFRTTIRKKNFGNGKYKFVFS